jgi:hypothetical protein
VLTSCSQNKDATVKEAVVENVEESIQSIKYILETQQEAWNKGDIDSFMNGYWKSSELTFIGSNGVTKGWEQTLSNYKKRYPDVKTMGRLEFETISLEMISDKAFQMIGKYTLYREEDQPSGFFTLLWKKIDEKWVIVSDQTC